MSSRRLARVDLRDVALGRGERVGRAPSAPSRRRRGIGSSCGLDDLDLARRGDEPAAGLGDGEHRPLARLAERHLGGVDRPRTGPSRSPPAWSGSAGSVSSTSAGAAIRALGLRAGRGRDVDRGLAVDELALVVDHAEREAVGPDVNCEAASAGLDAAAADRVRDLLQRAALRRPGSRSARGRRGVGDLVAQPARLGTWLDRVARLLCRRRSPQDRARRRRSTAIMVESRRISA